MLRQIVGKDQLDGRKLMDLYAEGNRENAEEFYPDEDISVGIQRVETEFLSFLNDTFLPKPENTYWVLEENGEYISALRLTELPERRFYLEALETHPYYRRKGFATKLLTEVTETLKAGGPFCICDCVSKRNSASIRTHKRAGFRIASDAGYDYLQKEADERNYGFEFVYTGE